MAVAMPQRPPLPTVRFSRPEYASVGIPPDQIEYRFHPLALKRLHIDLPKIDRGAAQEVSDGYISIDAIRLTGRIVSATIVGPNASEMISLFTLAIQRKMTLYQFYWLIFPYPTFSDGVRSLVETFVKETTPNMMRELGSYLRYRFAPPPTTGPSAPTRRGPDDPNLPPERKVKIS